MIPALRRLIKWAILVYAVTFGAVVVWTATFANTGYDEVEPVDVIVCLGAGMDPDGTLHSSAIRRVETCAALYASGAADRVHFTGGRAASDGPAAGAQMAALAETLGVPSAVMTHEDASLSTLQNALFSQPMLAEARSIRLVTEAFHLPRSYASFAILGPQEIYLTMSEPVRQTPDGGWNWSVLLREALAIWFNAGRLVIWYLAGLVGVEQRDAILA